MQESGVTARALAHELEVERSDVEAWIKGKEQPNTGTFRKLAKALNRPTIYFLQPAPPAGSQVAAKFRRHAGRGLSRGLTKEEDRFLRQARRFQAVVTWLRADESDLPSPVLPLAERGEKPADAAKRVRSWLKWTAQKNQVEATEAQVFNELRLRLEQAGVLVMLLPLGDGACRGFSLYEESAPLLVVNSAQTTPARVFTMLHELAHLLRSESSFDDDFDDDSQLERWCDRFAAAFLLPAAAVRQYVNSRFGADGVGTLSQARTFANRFKVSLAAACIRLAHLHLTQIDLYAQIPKRDHWKTPGSGFNPDPGTAAKRLREYGFGIVREVMDAESHKTLKRHDVQRYLSLGDDHYQDLSGRLSHIDADQYQDA